MINFVSICFFFSSPKTYGVTSFDRKKKQPKLITPPTSNFVQSKNERDVVTKIQSHMVTIQMLRKLQPLASSLAETPPGSVPTSFSSAGQEDCLIKLAPCAVSRLIATQQGTSDPVFSYVGPCTGGQTQRQRWNLRRNNTYPKYGTSLEPLFHLSRPCIDDSADVLDGFFTGAYDCLD
jgi:hypothetical protein